MIKALSNFFKFIYAIANASFWNQSLKLSILCSFIYHGNISKYPRARLILFNIFTVPGKSCCSIWVIRVKDVMDILFKNLEWTYEKMQLSTWFIRNIPHFFFFVGFLVTYKNGMNILLHNIPYKEFIIKCNSAPKSKKAYSTFLLYCFFYLEKKKGWTNSLNLCHNG